ncbi:MAG: two-component system, cell cycle response regulator [Patescibacteria group bacterium]|nr:two-component system, cell cycle response regulator [Patescibacteria group bacterium]
MNKEKILIALGDRNLSALLMQQLKELGYQIDSVTNGKDALEKMKSLKPDLVLIDTNLPVLNGYEVMTQKSFDREITKIPVIVVSNSGLPIQMNKLPSTPVMKDFIIKAHVEPREVIEKIEKALGREHTTDTPESTPKDQQHGVGKKVLWVEDDKLLSTILSKKIEGTGYKLLKAINGKEAFAFLAADVPDIIILDIMLPEMSGFEVLQKIKGEDRLRKVPVIMLSNLSKQGDIEKAKLLGANKFVVKAAVSLDEIIREIDALIKK